MAANPGLVEPMEVMVEAILALCTCDPDTLTGRVTLSGPLLEELGIEPHNLDGITHAVRCVLQRAIER